jgi:iron complex outermembrane receptor protein
VRRCIAAASLVLLGPAVAANRDLASLGELSLEELSNITITSVSKRAERLSDAASSVFVITGDDIRRSGATSLPEALRLAPNLQVARAEGNGWAISARGFNSGSADKLLVLIDGRSVYSPLFSGVFWEVQDLVLQDVERIEVISGPGGTLWGVNAVNGVINVITRAAADTQGTLVAAGGGKREQQAALRQGGTIGSDGRWRIYAKESHRSHTETADGQAIDDAMHLAQAGFRADWSMPLDKISLHGDAYSGRRGQPLPGTITITGVDFALEDIRTSGANLVGRWERQLGSDASVSGQVTYDHVERNNPPTFFDRVDIVDVQLQHAWTPTGGHSVVWGGQYRYAKDRVASNTPFFAFLPARLDQAWASAFAQDEISLGATLRLTIGARLEHNDYSGSDFLPSLRLAWKPEQDQLLWTAVSRTARAPSRLDHDIFVPAQPPFLLAGGPNIQSEIANVYEVGYRGRLADGASFAATVYRADYDRLRTQELAASKTSLFYGNGMRGSVQGVEMWGSYQALQTWRLHAGYNRLWQNLGYRPGSTGTAAALAATEGSNPSQQWTLRSSLDLPGQTELDLTARHVAELTQPLVPSYSTVDLRMSWRPRPDLELSVIGQNLVGPAHGEFTPLTTRTSFGRAVFVEVVSRF